MGETAVEYVVNRRGSLRRVACSSTSTVREVRIGGEIDRVDIVIDGELTELVGGRLLDPFGLVSPISSSWAWARRVATCSALTFCFLIVILHNSQRQCLVGQ